MHDIPPKTCLASKIAYQNPWITIYEDQTVDHNSQASVYGYVESNDSCMVVVTDEKDRLLLVRAFRYPSRSFGWELPGGGGNKGDLIEASKRELLEETGITAKSWQLLGKVYVCNGLMTEQMAICLAQSIDTTGTRAANDKVFSDTRFFTLDEIDTLIKNGDINDCQTLAGLYYYRAWQTSSNTQK